jgi:glycosyltransferase involved in cell wall biosynthesis
MRIAQIAPLAARVPPKKYGGTERVVYALTEELVRRGHDVTLFASGDSVTSAKLVPMYPVPLNETEDVHPIYDLNWPLLHSLERVFATMQNEFDIIHDHVGYASLPFAQMSKTPTLVTMHAPLNPAMRTMFEEFKKANLVTISRDMSRDFAGLNHVATVYNGLSMEKYPFSKKHGGYLLYVGRICWEKGTHVAIDVAQRLNLPLIIAAKVDDVRQGGTEYFKKRIKRRLTENIQWIGEVTEQERNRLMSKALAFLHPGLWREPFGLTMIEAGACGAPVIAFNRGSVPEVVEDKKSGFVVNTTEEMVEAVKQVGTINRAYCRAHALEHFNAHRMTSQYEELYRQVIFRKEISALQAQTQMINIA